MSVWPIAPAFVTGDVRVTDPDATSLTLLNLLRGPGPGAAWHRFAARYRPRIYGCCVAHGLQPADADDVTQAVLVKLVEKLPEFRYDPGRTFRGWLRVVTRNAVRDHLAARRPDCGSGDSAVLGLLHDLTAADDLAREVEAEYDRELLERALAAVRAAVPPDHWEAFRLTALEGVSGADAAVRLNMLVATVYTAKHRVQKLVRAEARRLEAKADGHQAAP